MCPCVGPHAPSLGRQLWGLPSRVQYLSPQGVLLPLVYGTTASPLWLELRGRSAWQATPSWIVYRLACHRLLPWLQVTFAVVPDAAWPGSDQWPWSTAPALGPVGRLGRPSASDLWGVGSFLSLGRPTCVQCPGPLGSCSPVCLHGLSCCVCGVLGDLAPVHWCARSLCCVACALSWATWLLFTGVPARCVVLCMRCPGPLGSCSAVRLLGVLYRVRCPGPLGSCSPVRLLGVLLCVCGVLGHLASCSPVCPLGVLFCVCGVLGNLAPLHRCARSVCCFAYTVSWATWLLSTGVPTPCVVLRVRCPGQLGFPSPVCWLGVLLPVCGVLGPLAPVHRCARSFLCFACAMSQATWLLFTGAPVRCVVLRLRCLGPLASCSPVRPLRPLLCSCWATWLLFTGVPARCVVLCLRCPGPPCSCSPVCPLGVLCCVYGVLGHLAPVHRCACSVPCFACAVSRATWLLLTGAPARCVVLRVRCPGPPGSCSPVCSLAVSCCMCGVPGHLAPVHRCARSVGWVACTVSWAAWLLYTVVLALCAVLWVARVVLRGRGVVARRSLVHLDGGCS